MLHDISQGIAMSLSILYAKNIALIYLELIRKTRLCQDTFTGDHHTFERGISLGSKICLKQ